MTQSPWQRPLSPREVDIAIIGGGVIGCATAFALRQQDPSLRLAIIEADRLAHGASGRNAGFVLLGAPGADPGAENPSERERAQRLWGFTSENARAIRDLDGRAFDLRWTGSVIAAGSTSEAEMLRRQSIALTGVEWMEPDAVHRRIGGRGFYGGLFIAEGGVLHPAKLVRHLAALSGATVLEGARVSAITSTEGHVLLRTETGTIRAGQVAVCLNAYLPKLLPELSGWVRPVRAQMLATEPVAPVLDVPVYSHDGYFYLRQRADGRLLLGGARHLHRDAEVGYEDATTPELQGSLSRYLADHFPRLGPAAVVREWSGTMGFSPDGLPVVGEAPGLPGVTVAAGFTGHGMGYALRFGAMLARRILGQHDPDADLFDASRFEAPPASPSETASLPPLHD
ncbi:MAG: FAD-binding oxidoreductase [Bacteroidota bacterium]